MDTKVIKILLLLMMGSVFLSIGYFLYNDNYSIEQLIKTFQLYKGDTLTYKIRVNQDGDSKECVIKGGYGNNVLTIGSVKDRRISDSYKDSIKFHQNCNEISKNTNLKFIGNFDNISMIPSDGQCNEKDKTCPFKKVDIDYATL